MVVFQEKCIGDIGEADVRIFVLVDRGVQLEVANVKTGEAYIRVRYSAVENYFCKFK